MSGFRCYSSSLRFQFYLFGKDLMNWIVYNCSIIYDDDDPRCCLCTNTQETKQVYMLYNVWNIVDITPKVEIEIIWDAFNLVWGISFRDGLVLIFPPQLTPLNSAPPDKELTTIPPSYCYLQETIEESSTSTTCLSLAHFRCRFHSYKYFSD